MTPTTAKSGLSGLAAVILGTALVALALASAAIANRQPFFLQDTDAYWNAGRATIEALWPKDQVQAAHSASKALVDSSSPAVTGLKQRITPDQFVTAGRSPYFGLPVYLIQSALGWWAVLAAQCIVFAVILLRFLNRAAGIEWRRAVPLALLIILPSGLPFVTGFLMPDFLTGLLILSSTTLLLFWRSLLPVDRVLFSVLVVFAGISHTSHLLILAGMTAFGIVLALARSIEWSRAGLIAGLLALTLGGAIGFDRVTEWRMGRSPIYPPFLLARMIADGPARQQINRMCDEGRDLIICRYRHVLNDNVEEFLWSEDPRNGVFSVMSGDERTRLMQEENTIVLATVMAHPDKVGFNILRNSAEQLFQFRLDFHTEIPVWNSYMAKLWPDQRDAFARSLHGRDAMPWSTLVFIQYAFIIASLAAIATWWGKVLPSSRIRLFVGMLLLGMALNALVCGIGSSPISRYQARVIWLIPLAAAMVVSAARRHGRAAVTPATTAPALP